MTRIAIIGPGAMGCYFAAKCVQSGFEVWLVDYDAQRAAFIQKQGIVLEHNAVTEILLPHVSTTFPDSTDLIIVLTKAYSTSSLIIPPSVPILTLQNGLGNAETLAGICGGGRILAGTTSEAVTWVSPGRIRHIAAGNTVIGSWQGCDVAPALDCLKDAGFNVSATDNPRNALWEKVVINGAINPLTALLNVNNGVLLERPECRKLMRLLVLEAVNAASTEGILFSRDMVELTEKICRITRGNVSSMLQDIRNRKQTEIESISGAIYRRSAEHQLAAPNTYAIYLLVRALETP